jgi:ribulose 1,5-bisphosphate synthetase/thiazole synthase
MTAGKTISYPQDIPVRSRVDVFVAGGGPAGVAACLTAARGGTKVYLAEAHTCFGGMGTAGRVPMFMKFTDGCNFLADGIGRELLDKLTKAGGAGKKVNENIPVNAEILKRVYDRLIQNCSCEFTFQTRVVGVKKSNEKIQYAICSSKSGLFAVEADVFIDCTGDGDLAAFAGAAFEKGDENGSLMPGTLCSLWANLNWDNIPPAEKRNHKENLEKAFKEGIFTVEDRHHSGIAKVGKSLGGANIGHTFGVDGTDEISITKALIQARKIMPEYEEYYKKYISGFENVELACTASLLGIRESRRITGNYILDIEDFKNRADFEDEIGRYCYEVDIHPASGSKKDFEKFQNQISEFHYKKGESYGIPYRILTPVNSRNILTAGRCVSADRYMQSSIRTMPGCYITGQAAGTAASEAVKSKTNVNNIDIKQLQNKLKEIGAYLPNS